MIALALAALLSQVSLPPTATAPACKGFSFSEATAQTEDFGYDSLTGRYHVLYSQFEALGCASVDLPWNAEFFWTIEYPFFNAVDCARARPRAALVLSNGSRVDVPMLNAAFKDGVCKTDDAMRPSMMPAAQVFVWSGVPQSRLKLISFVRHSY